MRRVPRTRRQHRPAGDVGSLGRRPARTLARAALLPDLVTAAASLASLASFDAEGLDYFAGMSQDRVDELARSSARS
jgi:hypothetical protein